MAPPSSPTVFPWVRHWSPRGQSPATNDGYLIPPGTFSRWSPPEQTSKLSTLSELHDVACLVLLGDVGTGKSFEIAAEADRLRRLPPSANHRTLRLDLKRRSAALIEQEAFSSPEFTNWLQGKHELTILFDSMDECWRRVTELGPLIIAHLRPHLAKKSLPRLRVRLSCRAAEWQDEIEDELRNAFGQTGPNVQVQVWQLAPLTEENVRVSAAASGLAPDSFLSQVSASDLNALAAHPITLRMLLDMAKAGNALGRTRADIYAAGCAQLCKDTHQSGQAPPRLKSTAVERLACAGHVAATCALTNRYIVSGSTEQRPTEEVGVVSAVDLLGKSALTDSGRHELTRESIADTLQTALFEAQPGGAYTWRHQSYAEYLTARYLCERHIPAEQLARLLCDTSGNRPRLWPQMEEIACWLVSLVPELFELLVADNADVFLRCDPAFLGPGNRKQIVAAYLEQVRLHEARTPRWSENIRLHRLEYPELASQLEPVITNRSENWYVRDLALDMARSCDVRTLSPILVELMFDRNEVKGLRHGAGVALRKWADEPIRALVKRRLERDSFDDDGSDNIRGCVLSILWPSHLTVEELLSLLTLPKQDNYSGAYRRFLSEDLVTNVTKANLVALLRWVSTVEPDSNHLDNDPFDGVCAKICLAAFQSLSEADVLSEFTNVVLGLSRHDGQLFRTDGRDLAGEAPLRRLFWIGFMAGNAPVAKTVVQASLIESGLILKADFSWVATEAAVAATSDTRARWRELAFMLFSPESDPDQIGLMQPLADTDAEATQRMLTYTSCPLNEGGERNWRKAHYYRERKRQAELAARKPLHALVDEALAIYNEGKPHAMWWLMRRLDDPARERDEDGTNASVRGWAVITPEQYQRILAVAPDYLAKTEVKPEEVYDPCQRPRVIDPPSPV